MLVTVVNYCYLGLLKFVKPITRRENSVARVLPLSCSFDVRIQLSIIFKRSLQIVACSRYSEQCERACLKNDFRVYVKTNSKLYNPSYEKKILHSIS